MTSQPILCYVTDSQALGGDASRLLEVIRQAVAAGVDWVQIREKQMATRALLELVKQAAVAAQGVEQDWRNPSTSLRAAATRIIVNDRLDVALAAGADGVHLGGGSMPVADVVSWLHREKSRLELADNFLVGASCHSLAEAQQAERDGASYVIFGPIFATPSKLQYGPPQGVARLHEVCVALRIPVLAIGGITTDNAADCFHAGAAGIAAIRLFQEAREPAATVIRLRQATAGKARTPETT